MFKGWAMKNWIDVQQKQEHVMRKMNKIIVKCSVTFYSKAWIHRNEMLHNTEKYREFVIEWHNRIVNKIEQGRKTNMKRHVRNQKIDVSKCDTGCMKLWNESTMKMMREAKDESENDMRNYFAVKSRN